MWMDVIVSAFVAGNPMILHGYSPQGRHWKRARNLCSPLTSINCFRMQPVHYCQRSLKTYCFIPLCYSYDSISPVSSSIDSAHWLGEWLWVLHIDCMVKHIMFCV